MEDFGGIGLDMDQMMEMFGGFDFSPEQIDAIANMVLVGSTFAKIKEIELMGQKYGIDEQELDLRKQQLVFEQSEKLPFERDKLDFQRQMQELQMQQEESRFENQQAIGEQNLAMGEQNLQQSMFQTLNQKNAYNANLMSGAFNREQASGGQARYRGGAARTRVASPLGF